MAVNRHNYTMTNISRKKTQTEDYKSAHKHLTDFIAQLNKQTAEYLIQELLSEAEQVMVTKRFAAIFMFNNNYTAYRVSETLSISTSSARQLYLQFEKGQFNNLLGCMKKKEVTGFLLLLSDIITAQVDMKARARLMNRTSR